MRELLPAGAAEAVPPQVSNSQARDDESPALRTLAERLPENAGGTAGAHAAAGVQAHAPSAHAPDGGPAQQNPSGVMALVHAASRNLFYFRSAAVRPSLTVGGTAPWPVAAAGEKTPSEQGRASRWSLAGLAGKQTVPVILNARDGVRGIITDVSCSPREGETRISRARSAKNQACSPSATNSPREHECGIDIEAPEASRQVAEEHEERNGAGASTCLGIVSWAPYEKLPALPARNVLGMTVDHPVRRIAIRLSIDSRLEFAWLSLALVHFLIALPEIQDSFFGCSTDQIQNSITRKCAHTLPAWHHAIFLGIFLMEAAIKITGLGLSGGKFAWWTQDHYNKLDILALSAYIYETVSLSLGLSSFTMRGLRLVRLMKPLGRLALFTDLETIFHAFGMALRPMATVLLFIWFILILFGIMGMSIYDASFRRRCVWADTLQVKVPEQFCHRVQENLDCASNVSAAAECDLIGSRPEKGPEWLGQMDKTKEPQSVDNNCGPLQLCLDTANPNRGFTSFDHLPAALLALFQIMSGDNDVQILWYAIQSEPNLRALTEIYFIVFTFLVIHVLINVFVAVFANIFADSRALFQDVIEKRLMRTRQSSSQSSSASSTLGTRSSGNEAVPPDALVAAEVDEETTDAQRIFKIKEKMLQEKEEEEKKRIKVGSGDWFRMHVGITFDPSTQRFFKRYFRDLLLYDTLSVAVTFTQAVCVVLIGNMESETVDALLEFIVENLNWFFLLDLAIQIVCDGSVSNHFKDGENVFKFLVTFLTTTGLALSMLGVGKDGIAALRGAAILRLLSICKYGFLEPIWLMLIKATGSLIPVMNLCLFNSLVAIVYFSIGRSLFGDTLSNNFRFNFSNMSRGYILLLAVLTGDSWSGNMYEAMATFCTTQSDSRNVCDNFYLTLTALFYMLWFFYGQFLFVTMFLAIILEAFAIEEFMDAPENEADEIFLNKDEAIEVIAKFQMVPAWHVSPGLLKIAFAKLSPNGQTIPQSKLFTVVRMVQPMTLWRISKVSGFVHIRFVLRHSLCECFANSYLRPWPGDEDYIKDEGPKIVRKGREAAEIEVANKMARQIKQFMRQLVDGGMIGQITVVAKIQAVLEHVRFDDITKTEGFVCLRILNHETFQRYLQIGGMFEDMIQDVMDDASNQRKILALANHDANVNEYVGLDLSKIDSSAETDTRESINDTSWVRFQKQIRKYSFELVRSAWFESFMLFTIILSSIFLCLETPHETIPGVAPYYMLRTADVIFNAIFCVELVAKSAAYGFYQPKSVEYMSYWQVPQNRIDLFVLIMAILEMTGAGEYIGSSTTKVIRLMKVMRPVRLLLRSEGLRAIIEALIASLKPMFYATLFLFIVCIMFSVTGMAFFRKKLSFCPDSSLDGSFGEGKLECVGSFMGKHNFLVPRAWSNPPWGSHFDSLSSSVVVLIRVLTLNWLTYYQLAQDAVAEDVQPVPGFSMMQSSLYFHLFLLVGSFFGLNLFASFMCDTFYSLQGTSQLEEVQWMGVQQMLRSNQPKIHRSPPKNLLSTFLRQALSSSLWQKGSALCLLLNVTFMGLAHSDQDAYFSIFLDDQNNVFFSIMCVEAFLNLIALGPLLYVQNAANRFDIFLITVTAATMIFADSLRAISQATRILRLSKFLRQLAKDKTIADTFETVFVSMSQVVNILIVLIVLLLMLSVLSVQLFGTVRPGVRLSEHANFSSFGSAFHTIFQLMFGEDFPSLWDDCSVEEPNCTPDILDSNGAVVIPSDCGGWSAIFFFPLVLVLTQYVMLNLFVGMIMNNFAYITTKEGNGAVVDENFVDAAFKYVETFDPKIRGQIPLELVYQFYNAIDAPFGNYGTTKNLGRYLCIREELLRMMDVEEESNVGWFYQRVYAPIKEHKDWLQDMATQEWMNDRTMVEEYTEELIRECNNDETLERKFRKQLHAAGLWELIQADASEQEAQAEDGDNDQTEEAKVIARLNACMNLLKHACTRTHIHIHSLTHPLSLTQTGHSECKGPRGTAYRSRRLEFLCGPHCHSALFGKRSLRPSQAGSIQTSNCECGRGFPGQYSYCVY